MSVDVDASLKIDGPEINVADNLEESGHKHSKSEKQKKRRIKKKVVPASQEEKPLTDEPSMAPSVSV